MRLARLEHLMDRRPVLLSSVLLRQNPHNCGEWQKRVDLFESDPAQQVVTYTEAVQTVDPLQAVGKLHVLWINYAKLYEKYGDLDNARTVFKKAVAVNFKHLDDLASVWCVSHTHTHKSTFTRTYALTHVRIGDLVSVWCVFRQINITRGASVCRCLHLVDS